MFRQAVLIIVICSLVTFSDAGQISGVLKKWHTVTIDFTGPAASESDSNPNPFLDYRLQVIFTGPDSKIYNVPGYFAGDGQGSPSGNIWRVHFVPDQPGIWTYAASFRAQSNIAISLSPTAGTASHFDGETGLFTVADRDPSAEGNFSRGRLEYISEHYLKFADGSYFIKTGADSPENFLAYSGFDNTTTSKFTLHDYAPHVTDWTSSDPQWDGGKGKGIIGAINYLASCHVNSIYVMPMNIGGDGQDCWPFAGNISPAGSSSNDNTHYDISKLRQWEIVLTHAQRKGMLVQMVLNEAERNNKLELDNATLGTERKLYYREMVARFGHLLALQWNMCEEYNLNLAIAPSMIISWAQYLRSVDPYNHPIAVHNSYDVDDAFDPYLGSIIEIMSIQVNNVDFGNLTEKWLQKSAAAAKKWVVMFDEFDRCGKNDDDSHSDSWPNLSGHGYLRKAVLWPTLISGGGVEYILDDLLNLENFRNYESMWLYSWYTRKFLEENTEFWLLDSTISTETNGYISADTLIRGEDPDFGGAQVSFIAGEVYVIYLPDASNDDNNSDGQSAAPPELDLRDYPGREFTGRWYNPRTGQFAPAATNVSLTGGNWASIGLSPDGINTNDWALLVKVSQITANAGPDRQIPDSDRSGSETVSLDGTSSFSPFGEIVYFGWFEEGNLLATGSQTNIELQAGTHLITLTVRDSQGNEDSTTIEITITTPQLVANAGPDIRIVDADQNGYEFVELDSSQSYHVTLPIILVDWTENGQSVPFWDGTNAVFETGSHTITLTVTASDGSQASDTVLVAIVDINSLTPGDIDGDNDVDIFDFLIFKSNYGSTNALWTQGDLDGDKDVDIYDFLIFKANYGYVGN